MRREWKNNYLLTEIQCDPNKGGSAKSLAVRNPLDQTHAFGMINYFYDKLLFLS